MAQAHGKKIKNGSSFKTFATIVLTLIILILISVSVAYYTVTMLVPHNTSIKTKAPNLITYEAEEILTNLKDRGYIKISMTYLIDNKKVEKELEQKEYEIKDNILYTLRSKTMAQVKDGAGTEQLRMEIKESINEILTHGEIRDVYFTNIIVN